MLKAIPGVGFPFTGGQRSLGLLSCVVKKVTRSKGRKSTASTAVVAIEGEEALEIINSWAPDLVITELSMPNIGGLELRR